MAKGIISLADQALARAIGEEFRKALAEDRELREESARRLHHTNS